VFQQTVRPETVFQGVGLVEPTQDQSTTGSVRSSERCIPAKIRKVMFCHGEAGQHSAFRVA